LAISFSLTKITLPKDTLGCQVSIPEHFTQWLNYSKVGGGVVELNSKTPVLMFSWSQWLNSAGTPTRGGGNAS